MEAKIETNIIKKYFRFFYHLIIDNINLLTSEKIGESESAESETYSTEYCSMRKFINKTN